MSYNFPPILSFFFALCCCSMLPCRIFFFFFFFSIEEFFNPFFSGFWNFYFQKEFIHPEVIKYSYMISPDTSIISYLCGNFWSSWNIFPKCGCNFVLLGTMLGMFSKFLTSLFLQVQSFTIYSVFVICRF